MCDIAIASMVIGGIGTLMSAAGQMQQANAAADAAAMRAQMSNQNAALAEHYAQDAEERGVIDANQHRQDVRRLQATQLASLAAGGLDVQTGSANQVLGDTAELGELDALAIRDNASREGFQHRMAAHNATVQGGLYTAEAANSRRAGFLNAGATLLSGAGETGTRWARYRAETAAA